MLQKKVDQKLLTSICRSRELSIYVPTILVLHFLISIPMKFHFEFPWSKAVGALLIVLLGFGKLMTISRVRLNYTIIFLLFFFLSQAVAALLFEGFDNAVHWAITIVSFLVVLAIFQTNEHLYQVDWLDQFLLIYSKFFSFLALCAVVSLIVAMIYFAGFISIQYIENNLMLFANFDSIQKLFCEPGTKGDDCRPFLKVPRFAGLIEQSSLLPTSYILPLGFYFYFRQKLDWKIFTVIVFLLLSLGGTVYLILIFAVVLFALYPLVIRIPPQVILACCIFIPASVAIAVAGLSAENTLSKASLTGSAQVLANVSDFNSPLFRIHSGAWRLFILERQFSALAQTYFIFPVGLIVKNFELGGGTIHGFLLGNFVFGGGVKLGLLGLVANSLLIILTFRRLNQLKTVNFYTKFGTSLLFAYFGFSFGFQDFGMHQPYFILILSLFIACTPSMAVKA